MCKCTCSTCKEVNSSRECQCDHIKEPQFKVGDTVYSLITGWGTVIGNNLQAETIYVPNHWYFQDGKYNSKGEQVLFHDKPQIILPKKKVKKWKWAYKLHEENRITKIFLSEEEMRKDIY